MPLLILGSLALAFMFSPLWLLPVLSHIEKQRGMDQAQAVLSTLVHGAGILALVAFAII